jgi:hypothetical protein
MGIPSVALAPLNDLLAQRINLVELPRVTVGALGGDAALIGAAAVAFERGGIGHPVSEWRRTQPSAAEPA